MLRDHPSQKGKKISVKGKILPECPSRSWKRSKEQKQLGSDKIKPPFRSPDPSARCTALSGQEELGVELPSAFVGVEGRGKVTSVQTGHI